MRKVLAFTTMFLFISVSIIPSTVSIVSLDDTTPPVTTYKTNPLKPNGENGFYTCNVTVILKATDDISGVDRIEYRIEGGSWETIQGDNGTFILDFDGDDMLIEYRAFDNAGNVEEIKWFIIDIDQAPPVADEIAWESYMEDGIWYADLIASATDATSLMNRVEFYIENEYQETIYGRGPEYVFTIPWLKGYINTNFTFHHYDEAGNGIIVNFTPIIDTPPPAPIYFGIIRNPEISKDNISFFAVAVICLFSPTSPFIFQHLTLPNNYKGYIGRYIICASFPYD